MDKTHIVHTKGRAANRKRFVVCAGTGKRPKMDVDLMMLHVIGYWDDSKTEEIVVKEVWIPFEEISHVESLVYRQRDQEVEHK